MVRQEVTCDVHADDVSLRQPDHVGHPHGSLRGPREDALGQLPNAPPELGLPDQDHGFVGALPRQLAEGDLGVEQVEARPATVDGVVAQDEGAGVAAAGVLPGAAVWSWRCSLVLELWILRSSEHFQIAQENLI